MTAKIAEDGEMVGSSGRYWVSCCVLLALACGHTAKSDGIVASGGAPNADGGAASGGMTATSGAAPVSEQAGQAGASGCPVTPAAGQWAAIGPDPYGFELTSDGSHLSGRGCLGGLAEPVLCSPLSVLADSGRHLEFVWNMKQAGMSAGFAFGYSLKMKLTLAPERTAMAGKVWTSLGSLDGDGQDIVLVRYPDPPLPPATVCSGGEPTGACFLQPLRSDRIREARVVELGGGDLLLLWQNLRGIGQRIASARFDAASGAWQAAEFLDDGRAPVDTLLLTASPQGSAMIAYRENGALLARAYDLGTKDWSEQQVVVAGDRSSDLQRPEALFVYDGGDATLITSSDAMSNEKTISAHDFVAATGAWKDPYVIEASANVVSQQWAADSDADRHALVVWVTSGPNEVWFSSRNAAATWAAPALLYGSDKQIGGPAVAVGKDGTAIVTWQEFGRRIASSAYSFETGAPGEPLTITSETTVDNQAVAFNDAGAPVAHFQDLESLSGNGQLESELNDGVWGAPRAVPADEGVGAIYSVAAGDSIDVARLHPRTGEAAPPPLERPRCEGY